MHSEGGNNYFLYSNPVVDELLERGRTVTDLDERIEIYQEAFRIIMTEDVPLVGLVQSYRPMALRSYVKGWAWNPLIRVNLRNVSIEK
jgi:peptide/nickel transport system substrate-binding protein